MKAAIARIEDARLSGLRVSADVYPYIASGTGLDASMPPWLFDGGMEAGIARLQDPVTRRRAITEMQGKGEPCGAAADDQDVAGQGFVHGGTCVEEEGRRGRRRPCYNILLAIIRTISDTPGLRG